MVDSNTYFTWTYSGNFPDAPDTSEYASSKGSSNDELHIVVVDTTGAITGTPTTTGTSTFTVTMTDNSFATSTTKSLSITITDTYTITYVYNGADGGNSQVTDNFTTGGTAISLPTPTKTGYTFGGWYAESGLTTLVGNAAASKRDRCRRSISLRRGCHWRSGQWSDRSGRCRPSAPTLKRQQ